MNDTSSSNRRILLIDDNAAIHDDFRKILVMDDAGASRIDAEAAAFFGETQPTSCRVAFELDSAFQGEEALAKVQQARAAGKPHAMAFVDMRMPPGWDGLETIRRLWQVYPDLEIVICTAYSDHSWQEIQQTLGVSDRVLILKKPFDKVEVQQLALAVTEKWNLRRLARLQTEGLEERVRVNQSQSESLVNVGHELLTPMNGILGLAGRLAETPLNAEQRKLLGDIQESSRYLRERLGDALQFKAMEHNNETLVLRPSGIEAA